MANIKGQNLRLFLNDVVVGAATNCNVHISTQVEDVSSKDITDNWARNAVTGMSWDASIDAYVHLASTLTPSELIDENTASSATKTTVGNVYFVDPIDNPGGQEEHRILILSPDEPNAKIYIFDPNPTTTSKPYAEGTGSLTVMSSSLPSEFRVGADMGDLDILCTSQPHDTAAYCTQEIADAIVEKQKFNVKFAYATGSWNRTVSSTLLTGMAYITDFSISAQNKQNGTYTIQLTGDGELTVGSDDE